MFKIVKRVIETIPPVTAAKWLKEFNNWPGQKPMKELWVDELYRRFTTGLFTSGDVSLAVFGNKTYLVNGQHTLRMCQKYNITIEVKLEEYSCDSRMDVVYLYAQFDTYPMRNDMNVMKAGRMTFSEDMRSLPVQFLAICGTALLYVGGGLIPKMGNKALTKSDKVDLVKKHKGDVLILHSYYEKSVSLYIGCAMAIITTHRAYPGKAKSFWDRVMIGDEMKAKSPQYRLHQTLSNVKKYIPGCFGKGSAFQRAIYSHCVSWFNAFITGEERSKVQYGAMNGIPQIVQK